MLIINVHTLSAAAGFHGDYQPFDSLFCYVPYFMPAQPLMNDLSGDIMGQMDKPRPVNLIESRLDVQQAAQMNVQFVIYGAQPLQ